MLASVGMAGLSFQPSFAQRQTASGSGPVQLTPTGELNGVDLTGNPTLTVGVVGGPETDIFTSNSSLASTPLAVSTFTSSQGNIQFNSSSTVYGNIGVTQPGGPFLLNISGGNTGTVVNFLGSVYATSIFVTGTGALNFDSGSTNDGATNFNADGIVSLAPNTTLIGALTTTAGADTGTLSLGNSSVLNGAVGGAVGLKAVNVVGGSDIAGGVATISGATDTYSVSLGTNTLDIGGALTIANAGPGGVINTTIASQSVYGNITVVGATNLGPTLTVNVTVPSTTSIPVGSLFNIVHSSSAQSGTNGTVVTVTIQDPTNPLYSFTAVPLAGTQAGLVEIETKSIPLLAPITLTPGAPLPPTQGIAVAIIPTLLALQQDPQINSVIAGINSLTSLSAVDQALAELAPSTADFVTPLVTFQETRAFEDLLSSHLQEEQCQSIDNDDQRNAHCQLEKPRSGWWLKGFGSEGSNAAQGGFTAYNSSNLGTMIGYDTLINMNTRAGVGIGYAQNYINQSGSSANTNFGTYQVIAYIGHNQGPWYVNGDLSFGWNDYSGNRQVNLPEQLFSPTSKYSGQTYSAFLSTGYNFYINKMTITPLASLQYSKINLDSYGETGAGAIDLKVKSQSNDFLESGLGIKLSKEFQYQEKILRPEIHAKWLHELVNPTLNETAAFSVPGAPYFTTPGLKPSADTINLGVSITLLTCSCTAKNWSLQASYDYYRSGNRYSANQGMLRFNHSF